MKSVKHQLLLLVVVLALGAQFRVSGQAFRSAGSLENVPEWAQTAMRLPFYGPMDSTAWAVAEHYRRVRSAVPKGEQTYEDRYVRAWLRARLLWGTSDQKDPSGTGDETAPSTTESATPWSPLGPWTVVDNQGNDIAEHANVYSMAQGGGGVLYAGTEPGQVYRSSNYGANWALTALQVPFQGGVQALAANAVDGQTVYAGTYNAVYRSVNGGATWVSVLSSNSLNVNELLMMPGDTNALFAACDDGLYRSANRGATWISVVPARTYDIAVKPGSNGRTVYAVGGTAANQNAQFFRSTNYGLTFQAVGSGWYQSTHPNRADFGARLAVSPADTQRVYAYLIGESKPGDAGYIGVFRSGDGGNSWTLPNAPTGGPYTGAHPNLAVGSPSWTYHQGFYNCALMANPLNANEVLVGGLNLWKSTDGGATFTVQSGYAGGTLGMHVDQQDFRLFSSPSGGVEAWISTDGGIYRSSDFFTTPPQVRMTGMQATEFWGHGAGWNEDVFVSGAYHNGVIARRESYPAGGYLQLGGGEPASGYVDPFRSERVVSADIGGALLPAQWGQSASYFGIQQFPNESYWPVDASNMVFDPRTSQRVFVGFENKLLGSSDGGQSYSVLATFGTDPTHRMAQLAVAPNQPRTFYAVQRHGWSPATLHRSLDSGTTWVQLPLPGNLGTRLTFAVAPNNANKIYLTGPEAPDGQKIWRSSNGGTTWSNWSTAALNGQEIRSVLAILSPSNLVVLGTQSKVLYRTDTSATFRTLGTQLPQPIQTRDLNFSYKHQSVRVSTYGRGLWSLASPVSSGKPLARAQVERPVWVLSGCGNDSVSFDDHSLVAHSGTSWTWMFPGGSPGTSNRRNPKVSYAVGGLHTAQLIVQNAAGQRDTAWVSVTVVVPPALFPGTDFQSPVFPAVGLREANEPGAPAWQRAPWGSGEFAALADNYSVDAQGKSSSLIFPVSADGVHGIRKLTFDRAYAPYGFPYSDTLQLVLALDCQLQQPLWVRTVAGTELATAPALQNALFVPQTADWVRDSVDLDSLFSALNLTGPLYFGFRNVGRWGQGMYLDNVQIRYTVGRPEQNLPSASTAAPKPQPNPITGGNKVRFMPAPEGLVRADFFDAQGRPLGSRTVENGVCSLPSGSSGLWTYRLVSADRVWVGSLLVFP